MTRLRVADHFELELSWCQGTKLIRKASTKFKNVKYDNEPSVSLGNLN